MLYCGVIGVLRTLSEGHALYQLFTHPDMTAAEAFSSAICSHLMTPAINAALALLQVCLQLWPCLDQDIPYKSLGYFKSLFDMPFVPSTHSAG